MKISIASMIAGVLGSVVVAAPSARIDTVPTVIPQPVEMTAEAGKVGLSLAEGIKVHYRVSRSEEGRAAIRALMAAGITQVLPEENEGELEVLVEPGHGKEWYALSVTPEGVRIRVSDVGALHLAAQTLAQSILTDAEGKAALPCMEVVDEPLSVIITFIDGGVPYDPLTAAAPDTTLSAEERAIGGLGIFMVRKSMDEITYRYENGSNILSIRKKLRS